MYYERSPSYVIEILAKDKENAYHWHPMGCWSTLESACYGFKKNGPREVLYNMWEIVALRYAPYDGDNWWVFDNYLNWKIIDQRAMRKLARDHVRNPPKI